MILATLIQLQMLNNRNTELLSKNTSNIEKEVIYYV